MKALHILFVKIPQLLVELTRLLLEDQIRKIWIQKNRVHWVRELQVGCYEVFSPEAMNGKLSAYACYILMPVDDQGRHCNDPLFVACRYRIVCRYVQVEMVGNRKKRIIQFDPEKNPLPEPLSVQK